MTIEADRWRFFRRVRRHEIDEVRRMLASDPSLVHARDPDCFDYDLLAHGAWLGSVESVRALIAGGERLDVHLLRDARRALEGGFRDHARVGDARYQAIDTVLREAGAPEEPHE